MRTIGDTPLCRAPFFSVIEVASGEYGELNPVLFEAVQGGMCALEEKKSQCDSNGTSVCPATCTMVRTSYCFRLNCQWCVISHQLSLMSCALESCRLLDFNRLQSLMAGNSTNPHHTSKACSRAHVNHGTAVPQWHLQHEHAWQYDIPSGDQAWRINWITDFVSTTTCCHSDTSAYDSPRIQATLRVTPLPQAHWHSSASSSKEPSSLFVVTR